VDLIEQLARVENGQARARLLRQHRECWNAALIQRMFDEVVRLARIDVQQAGRLARAAMWLADQLDDDAARAQSLRALGHVSLSLGRHREAVKRYERALELFRALKRDADIARTLNGSLQSLISLGRYRQAYAWAEEARGIFERHGNRLGLGRLDINVGNILYRQDRFEEALALYERAFAQLSEEGNPQDVAAVLSNMAMVYINLSDFDQSLDTHRRARDYCERHGMPLLVLRADYNIAYLYYMRGEYTRAIDLYRATQEECDALNDTYHSALCDMDCSEMYLELNLSDEAALLGKRAMTQFNDLGMDYEMAKSLTNMAIAISSQGDLGESLDLFSRARRLFLREQNEVWLALVDFYEGLVLFRNGQYRRVRRLCERALAQFARVKAPGRQALCELLLARLELHAGNFHRAEQACDAAFARIATAGTPNLTYQAHFVRGLIRDARADTVAALAAFRAAHADLEQLRTHLHTEGLKVAFLADKLAVYESLVTTCLALGPSEENKQAAFGYIEEAKSRSLADLIAFRAATLEPHVHGAVAEAVGRIRHELNWYYRQLEFEEVSREKRSPERLATLHQRTTSLETELARSLDALRRTDAEFAALQSGTADRIEEIRSTLDADTLLLEYYQAQGRYYVCLVSRDALDVIELCDVEEVRKRLSLLQFQLLKFRLGPSYIDAFGSQLLTATETHLRALYSALIAPIRNRLRATHLVVVPHDILHMLPFHALLDGNGRFLIDEFTVSYAPSATVYRLCCQKRPVPHGEALIMGLPDHLAPCIADEVRAVSEILPNPRVFLDGDATAAQLRVIGPTSRFVHIATHGFFRRDNPMFSSIRLGGGPLCVYDLYELRLSADLVTLSGCSTGLNVVVGGDEILGLVRGLLYAGARSVLLTLWDAHDRSTADFMQAFYKRLNEGATKAHAAQAAMQEIREQYRHPYYWAPFSLMGDTLSA
jgi:CHAT domain-containing protein/Tfp pilus assembly protein PilF